MFEYLKNKLPRRHEIVSHWTIRPFAHRLRHPRLWHLHRVGVSRALLIGLFCAWVPIPLGQMAASAVLAWFARANIPVAISATWLSNPLTYLPLVYGAFWLGDNLLFYTFPGWEKSAFALSAIWTKDSILYPIVLGSLILGAITGFTGYFVARYLWRKHILAKRRKHLRRRGLQPQLA